MTRMQFQLLHSSSWACKIFKCCGMCCSCVKVNTDLKKISCAAACITTLCKQLESFRSRLQSGQRWIRPVGLSLNLGFLGSNLVEPGLMGLNVS